MVMTHRPSCHRGWKPQSHFPVSSPLLSPVLGDPQPLTFLDLNDGVLAEKLLTCCLNYFDSLAM